MLPTVQTGRVRSEGLGLWMLLARGKPVDFGSGSVGIVGDSTHSCSAFQRCCPTFSNQRITHCPVCMSPARIVSLLPMDFTELDKAAEEAAKTNLSNKRGKKRQNATVARLQPHLSQAPAEDIHDDLRTGRWTQEETDFCDALIGLFESGFLPIPEKLQLNTFLSSMLKSKQSRLTKKMKNARLSSRQYARSIGYIPDDRQAIKFSQLEADFIASIRCRMERAEIRFHMQKQWREFFSSYCVGTQQKLDADAWIHSVEEMERRSTKQKNAARLARRKILMGNALTQDRNDQQNGVFIDTEMQAQVESGISGSESESHSGVHRRRKRHRSGHSRMARQYSPFIAKVLQCMARARAPFEYVDVWVPSFMSSNPGISSTGENCRLTFAGSGVAEHRFPENGDPAEPLPEDDYQDLVCFGEYSEKFSFDVGCGLPGRVYMTGIPSWEQGVQNAPSTQFERRGGASQWGIQTVLCVPIPSPNVGRLVVLFYSTFDRSKDHQVVSRLVDELTSLLPAPRWKLTVDLGAPTVDSDAGDTEDRATLRRLVDTFTPADKNSAMAKLLPGFMTIRALLQKRILSNKDEMLMERLIASLSHYSSRGHAESAMACMLARDAMSHVDEESGSSLAQSHTERALAASEQQSTPTKHTAWQSSNAVTSQQSLGRSASRVLPFGMNRPLHSNDVPLAAVQQKSPLSLDIEGFLNAHSL